MKIKLVKSSKQMTLNDVKYGQAFRASPDSPLYIKLKVNSNTGIYGMDHKTWALDVNSNEFCLYSFGSDSPVSNIYDVELELTKIWSYE